ncbi:hypothetical protein JZO83_06395 [Enterococcus sp. DIV1298c]|nr:hypothetical protein [Enterococcus sp. DIV1298c]
MRRKSREKIQRLIILGITTSIIMAIFSFILVLQERYFWTVISMVGAIVGFICFFGLKIEINKIEDN